MSGKISSSTFRTLPEEQNLLIRRVQKADNAALAGLIRTVMTEFGAVGPGFSIMDPEVDYMFETYSQPRHAYWVLEDGQCILGGGGYGPLAGEEETLCELRKMYFYPALRGRGLGQNLLDLCLRQARSEGYTHCYLESLSHMQQAEKLYRRAGFKQLDGSLGQTGHSACDTYFIKAL